MVWYPAFPFKLLRSAFFASETYLSINVLDLAQAAGSLILISSCMLSALSTGHASDLCCFYVSASK